MRALPAFGLAALAALLAFAAPVRGLATGAAAAIGTAAQSKSGDTLYAAKCSMCHGTQLEGGAGPPLSGPNMTTLGVKTHLSVGDMFGYITTNMPLNAPASLSKDQYVVILTYILRQNGYPAAKKPLTFAAAESSKVLVRSYK